MRSYTEITQYRRCQRKHYYSRVLDLEPIQMGWRPDFGIWMHELLGAYYSVGDGPGYKHRELTEKFEAEVVPFTADEDILAVPDLAWAVFERYHDRYAPEEWEVLHVEESFNYDGIGITPDVVVRTPGGIYVVDHKTSASIPEEWDLMADTQHLLYVGGVRRIYGEEVQGVIFNYMRSKLPTEPRLNKTVKKELGFPDINNVARIDTDYDTLVQFAADNGVPPYTALTDRLAELQYTDPFFRRLPLLTPQEACDQALYEAQVTKQQMEESERQGWFPRTVLPQSAGVVSCNACSFKEICQAELFGLDTESAKMMYQERTPLNREYKEVSKAA